MKPTPWNPTHCPYRDRDDCPAKACNRCAQYPTAPQPAVTVVATPAGIRWCPRCQCGSAEHRCWNCGRPFTATRIVNTADTLRRTITTHLGSLR